MTASLDRRLLSALVCVLSWPWSVQLAVVAASAAGARPLHGRAQALCILLGASLLTAALGRVAWRSQRSQPAYDEGTPAPARWLTSCLCAGGILSFVLPLLLGATLPVVAYDALWYRLPVIAQWLDAGAIRWVHADDQFRNGYPLGQEAVSAVVAAATGTFQLTDVTSFLFVASGALTLWLLAEACRIRRAFAAAAAATFVLTPMVILNASSGYVDAAFGGATVALLGLAALLGMQTPSAILAVALGMAAANVLALKGTGLVFCAVVCATLAVRHGLARRAQVRVRSRDHAWQWLLSMGCAAPGLFWHARNLLHTGNPMWPVAVRFAGHTLLPGVGSMEEILDVANNTPPELLPLSDWLRVATTWAQWSGPAQVFDERLAGLGWAWPCLALPALAVFAWKLARRYRDHAAPIGWLALMTGLCFLLQPMHWWSRYTLWVWGAGALVLAIEAEHLTRNERHKTLLAGLLLFNLLTLGEAGVALSQASGAGTALLRWSDHDVRYARRPTDAHLPINAAWWVAPSFWSLGLEHDADVCRGSFKAGSDDAILDGVFAQLSPRPRVHVVLDDDDDWTRVRDAARAAGCQQLLLLQGSPVLARARRDAQVSVGSAVAFDPLFVVDLRSDTLAHAATTTR